MRFFTTGCAILAALLINLSAFTAVAQTATGKYNLMFRSGAKAAPANIRGFVENPDITSGELVQGRYYRLIQFQTIPTDEQRAVLAGQDVRLLEYLPKRAYVASLPQGFDRQQLLAANVRSVVAPGRDFKLHPLLEGQRLPAWALKEKGKIDLNINMYTDLDPNWVIPRLKARGFEVLKRHDLSHYVELRVPIASLDDVVDLPYISFVEPIAEPGEPENYTARTQHRSNIINADHANGMHYDGSGVAVMMQDDGDIGPHIDYTGRIGQYTDGNNGDHGDHVGGTIFGAGNLNPTTRGMATGADLYVYWAAQQGYPGFDSIPSHYNSLGIRITSTSYSDGCNAGYTNRARTMDIQSNSFGSLLHVFSAGNNGFSDCSYGAGAGWGNVTGGHKVGKNVITVANLDLNDNISGSSSRGPAHDGRIKPDVSAKGSSVFSTSDPNTYVFKSGTSMSCPGTSGTMAQLYHAYRDINGGTDPDGGLMKAIMLNTCEDLGNEGPDFIYGWGRINALRAVETIQNQTYMTGTISQGGSNTHTINVPSGTKQLRVMVYWTDPEASVNANTALVNNLDMTLTDPSSNTTLPWLLDYTPTVASLSAPATHGVDSVNNMEQVVIDDPAMGAFTVTLNGTGVPQGPQDYWVVYEVVTDRITLTYPIGGESFVPGEVEKIRWDALGDTGTFALEYSLDNGVTWTMINNAVSGSIRFFNWTIPQALTGEAMVRITRGANTDDSDAAFSIIGVPNTVSIGFGCPDSFLVTWTAVTGATAYEVSMLGAKYMDSIGVSTTTSFTVTGVNPLTEYWVAVKALGPQNAIGRRTVAIRKSAGTFNCPLDNDIELTLISSPLNQGFQSCHGDSTDVTVEFVNQGLQQASGFNFSYQLNGGPVVTETFTGTVSNGTSAFHTFAAPTPVQPGPNTLVVWVTYPQDQNAFNDTLVNQIEGVTGVVWSEPCAADNLETQSVCSNASDCGDTECPLSGGWYNERNGITDDIDWRVNFGNTPSNGTGTSIDHNPGTPVGRYLYLEASFCFNSTAHLMSPCLDLTQSVQPSFSFWYHMFGQDMGQLRMDVWDGSTWTLDVMAPLVGNQGGTWQQRVVDLSAYVGNVINLRFRGTTGPDFTSDILLDDFQLIEPPVANFGWEQSNNVNEIVFTDSSLFATSHTLKLGDGTTIDSANYTSPLAHVYPTHGSYQVTLVVSNSCGGTDSIVQIITVEEQDSIPESVGEEPLAGAVRLFPNPSDGAFTLLVNNQAGATLNYYVTDLQGRIVQPMTRNAIGGDEARFELDLTRVAAGLYLLHLDVDGERTELRLEVF